jgi:RHS repeat-associated protein
VLPLGQRFSYLFDANGNLRSQTDANGKTATMSYDLMNRLTNESYQDGTVITHAYNAMGQKKTVTDARGVTSFNYDVRDRLISRTDPDGRVISYTFDAASNRTAVTIPSDTTTYSFDALNRLDTVTNGSDVTGYGYDAVGNLVRTTLPNGVIESRNYDLLNRLTKLESKKDANVLVGFAYTLNPVGMRTSVTEQDGRRVDYKYDSLYRLTEEKITDSINGNKTVGYLFDPVGNRLSKTDNGVQTTYTFDANDRLISDGTSTYGYDSNGNTISVTKGSDTTVNTWDDKGRLIKVVITSANGSKTVEYKYNSDGIRVASIEDGVETRYLIDDNRDYAQVLEEYKPDGTVNVSYVYGRDLISENRGVGKSFYLVDGLGSVRALTDNSGAITDRYNYDAYGNLISSSGNTINNYRFAGEQFEKNLGQYYLRDRYYGTDIGRFTRADKFEGNTSDPLSLHKYSYANGNPINGTDPTGLFTFGDALVAIQIIGILSNGIQLGFNLYGAINADSDQERLNYEIAAGFNLLGLFLATPSSGFLPPASGGATALLPAVVSTERVIGSVAIPISQNVLSIVSSGNSGYSNIDVKDDHVNKPKHCLDDLAPTWVEQRELLIDAVSRIAPNLSGSTTPQGQYFSFSSYIRNSNGVNIPTEIRGYKFNNGKISINTAFVPKNICSHPIP